MNKQLKYTIFPRCYTYFKIALYLSFLSLFFESLSFVSSFVIKLPTVPKFSVKQLCARATMISTSNLRSRVRSMSIFSLSGGKDEDSDDSTVDDAFGAPVGPLPSVSSKVNYQETSVEEENLIDLWVVGCGTLGFEAVKLWMSERAKDRTERLVVAETASHSRHEQILALNSNELYVGYKVEPRLRADRTDSDAAKARNVLICIPPSATAEYDEELFKACRLWAGPKYGRLVFTSSIRYSWG